MSKKQVIICELIDRRPSTFVLEGTHDSRNPIRLDSPGAYFLKPTSVVKQPDGTYRKIRYIDGCDTIFVDEQERKGAQPNPQIDRARLVLENGRITAVREGRDVALYDFLRAHEMNTSNPNRPESAEAIFEELNLEAKAEKRMTQLNEKMEAFKIISELSYKGPEGKFIYDEEKISFICNLFGLPAQESIPLAVEGLAAVADAYPLKFVQTIADKRSEMRVDIEMAKRMNVVSITGDHASFASNGKNFYAFKTAKKNEEKISELVDYFLTPAGKNSHTEMSIELEAAKRRSVELVD